MHLFIEIWKILFRHLVCAADAFVKGIFLQSLIFWLGHQRRGNQVFVNGLFILFADLKSRWQCYSDCHSGACPGASLAWGGNMYRAVFMIHHHIHHHSLFISYFFRIYLLSSSLMFSVEPYYGPEFLLFARTKSKKVLFCVSFFFPSIFLVFLLSCCLSSSVCLFLSFFRSFFLSFVSSGD